MDKNRKRFHKWFSQSPRYRLHRLAVMRQMAPPLFATLAEPLSADYPAGTHVTITSANNHTRKYTIRKVRTLDHTTPDARTEFSDHDHTVDFNGVLYDFRTIPESSYAEPEEFNEARKAFHAWFARPTGDRLREQEAGHYCPPLFATVRRDIETRRVKVVKAGDTVTIILASSMGDYCFRAYRKGDHEPTGNPTKYSGYNARSDFDSDLLYDFRDTPERKPTS